MTQMRVTDAVAAAEANGWRDDSRYARRDIRTQLSLLRGRWFAAVVEREDGTIAWSVNGWDDRAPAGKGSALTLDAARDAAGRAIRAAESALF